jgi:hypothetical protein
MIIPKQRKTVRVLFDEYHSESWSVSEARAREMQPEYPLHSSYQIAADALAGRDFVVARNTERELLAGTLAGADVLALVHPCDPKWERTTSTNSPQLSRQEIADIQQFVQAGGGLLVITEYEHDKYGDNLNELLAPFGLQIQNTTVLDTAACYQNNPAWFFAEPAPAETGLGHLVERACFYQAGSCVASGHGASIAWRSTATAAPRHAGVVGAARYGAGRVVVVTDSLLFGDNHIREFDHVQLWLNVMYWCAAPAFQRIQPAVASSPAAQSEAWLQLKAAVNTLRQLQNPDGTVPAERREEAAGHARSMTQSIRALEKFFPHETEYLRQVVQDLAAWVTGGFQKPDFAKSLAAFNPQRERRDGIEHLWVMPMYTPNASSDWRFEAMIYRVPWPDWLAELERTLYQNERIVPGHFVDFTDGYDSECAVLFPETVALTGRPSNNFATIFCDREAKRYQRCVTRAAEIVQLQMHPQLECFLGSLALIQDAYALWDVIHDKSHSVGELPFDPFMIRKRAPFWMYGLEELRVDLRSFCEATRLAREGFPFAMYVTYAILFDRIFRFPITGKRVRNYDALGGQLLFSYLHQKDALIWHDNKLSVNWKLLPDAVDALREELLRLYKLGTDCSKMSFWIAAHDLVSTYVRPNLASKWKKDTRVVNDESDPKQWIDLVHDDEFPLGNFHTHLLAKMTAKT